jgi:chromosome segregation ATPase
MTTDERLAAMTRHLELMILETEKHDQQIAALTSRSAERWGEFDRRMEALLSQSADHDARMSRMGEHVDALTQTVQLLALESEKHDRQFEQTNRQFEQVTKLVADVAEGTAKLLRVAEMHEHRLDSHDDRLENLG